MERNNQNQVIFFGGLNPTFVYSQLLSYIKKFDKAAGLRLKQNSNIPHLNRGFAFIFCSNRSSYDKILNTQHIIDGRVIDCKVSHGGQQKSNDLASEISKKIFIKNFNDCVDNQILKDYFSLFGEVKQAYVIYDQFTKKSKNFGFTEFYEDHSVKKVLNIENHFICEKRVECQKYIPRLFTKNKSYNYKAFDQFSKVVEEKNGLEKQINRFSLDDKKPILDQIYNDSSHQQSKQINSPDDDSSNKNRKIQSKAKNEFNQTCEQASQHNSAYGQGKFVHQESETKVVKKTSKKDQQENLKDSVSDPKQEQYDYTYSYPPHIPNYYINYQNEFFDNFEYDYNNPYGQTSYPEYFPHYPYLHQRQHIDYNYTSSYPNYQYFPYDHYESQVQSNKLNNGCYQSPSISHQNQSKYENWNDIKKPKEQGKK